MSFWDKHTGEVVNEQRGQGVKGTGYDTRRFIECKGCGAITNIVGDFMEGEHQAQTFLDKHLDCRLFTGIPNKGVETR